MRKALSLVLGLLVLLTAFSGLTSAVYSQIEHFDDTNFSFSRLMGDNIYTVRDFKILPETMQVEVFEIYFKSFDKPSYGAVLWYFREGSGDFYGIFLGGSDSSITLSSLPSPLRFSRQDYGSVPFPTDGSEVVIRLKWDDTIGAYKLQLLDVVSGELQLIAEANTTLTTLLSATEWGIANDLYAQATPTYSVSNSILTYTIGDIYSAQVDYVRIDLTERQVKFNIKDALTGQSLTGVTVKEGNTILGTINDGDYLSLLPGDYILTFEKSGYRSVTKTVNVPSDTSVSVEMYPSDTAFKFLNFPSSIETYENTIYELTFTISPIDTSGTYNTYLSISGLSNVLEVKKAGQVVSPDSSGKYYLGDIPSDTQISIKFKAGSIGTHAFSITLTSGDAVGSTTYTTTKQVSYNVMPLPFSVQFPSEWQVGTNELRVSESSGQSIVITAILKDDQGTEVWSDSASLGPYEAYTFNVNVPSEGSYTLELQFLGQTAMWDITVNPSVVLLTETITAKEGDIATVQVKISNPSSATKYYDIVLEGPIIEGNVTKSVSVAPLSEKTVDVSFQVPTDLTYDAYDLNVKVYEGDALQFTGIVHLVIDSGGGFLSFFGGDSSIDSWIWLGAGLLALLVFVMGLRRR